MPLIELQLFKSGEYPQGVFTENDVQEIVDSYNPELHEAPLVVGHKSNDERAKSGEPAYGYIKKLKRIGATLFGDLDYVEKAKELMQTTHRRWSVELYPKGKLKEVGGKLYLKAVALLGAAAPQVKGLAPAKFLDESDDTVVIFQEETKMGGEPQVITDDQVKTLGTKIVDGLKGLFPKFSEGKTDDGKSSDDASITELINDMSNIEIREVLEELDSNERVAEVAASMEEEAEEVRMAELEKDPNFKFRKDHQSKAIVSWVDEQIKAKKLSPKAKDAGIVSFMELLCVSEDGGDCTMKFSEKGEEMTPLVFFQKVVEDNLTAPEGDMNIDSKDKDKKKDVKDNPLGINFAEKNADGDKIEMANLSLAEKAEKLAKEEKIDFSEALVRVARVEGSEHP